MPTFHSKINQRSSVDMSARLKKYRLRNTRDDARGNLQPSTFNLQPSTFNLQPSTFNLQPRRARRRRQTSSTLERELKAEIRKNPSPAEPNPEPGVMTT